MMCVTTSKPSGRCRYEARSAPGRLHEARADGQLHCMVTDDSCFRKHGGILRMSGVPQAKNSEKQGQVHLFRLDVNLNLSACSGYAARTSMSTCRVQQGSRKRRLAPHALHHGLLEVYRQWHAITSPCLNATCASDTRRSVARPLDVAFLAGLGRERPLDSSCGVDIRFKPPSSA